MVYETKEEESIRHGTDWNRIKMTTWNIAINILSISIYIYHVSITFGFMLDIICIIMLSNVFDAFFCIFK